MDRNSRILILAEKEDWLLLSDCVYIKILKKRPSYLRHIGIGIKDMALASFTLFYLHYTRVDSNSNTPHGPACDTLTAASILVVISNMIVDLSTPQFSFSKIKLLS